MTALSMWYYVTLPAYMNSLIHIKFIHIETHRDIFIYMKINQQARSQEEKRKTKMKKHTRTRTHVHTYTCTHTHVHLHTYT